MFSGHMSNMGTGMFLDMGVLWLLVLMLVVLGIVAFAKYIFGSDGRG